MEILVIKNPDAAVRADVEAKLIANELYCPCKAVKTPDTKCMCKEFRDKIANKELGTCHCGLFQVVEKN